MRSSHFITNVHCALVSHLTANGQNTQHRDGRQKIGPYPSSARAQIALPSILHVCFSPLGRQKIASERDCEARG